MWQCGDPYEYPIPDQEGNNWERLLEPLLEADKVQCEAWKDEVQNLLIFAGLFSAVVTAFVIDSKTNLRPDKEDAIIDALNRFASKSDDPSNAISALAQPTISFSPPSSSVQINIFWFISLILSLTAAILGIVSLQWLREHQKYPSSLSPKQRFAIYRMRQEGLQQWLVPEIFASLPILLQLALVLFLLGMIDLVLSFEAKVFIPIIVAIGIPLVFLLATTILPSLQAFSFCLPLTLRSTTVPTQCPYKSPQSHLLRWLLTAWKPVFRFYSSFIHGVLEVVLIPSRLFIKVRARSSGERQRIRDSDSDRQETIDMIFTGWKAKNWLLYDEAWVKFRDISAKASFDHEIWPSLSNRNSFKQLDPLYDLTKGTLDIVRDSQDAITQFRTYHCVWELSLAVIEEKSPDDSTPFRPSSLRYFQHLWDDQAQSSTTIFSILGDRSHEMIQDENAFIILSKCRHPQPGVAQHFMELHIRLTNYVYLHPRTIFSASLALTLPENAHSQLLRLYGIGNRRPLKSSSSPFDNAISSQFASTVELFFRAVLDLDLNDTTLASSVYAAGFGDLLTFMTIRQPDDSIQPILNFISSNLQSFLNGDRNLRSDFLFYTSASYVRALSISDPYLFQDLDKWNDIPTVMAFLPTLREYRRKGQPSADLRAKLGIPEDSDAWWDFLKRDHEARPRRQETLSRARLGTPDSESTIVVGLNPSGANFV